MNPSGSFFRKIAFLIAFVVLAIPIVWLGAPSTLDDPGGRLAQLRTEARLGQADIGAIDPASETIRLITLGLRGPAVTMLWSKANEFKKTENWTNFQATLEQLARLQPYFIKVWEYQAWNLSYNVSVEVDNVRDRFYYVKQGIKYLKQGIGYNRENPTLLDDLGWFTGNKVGRADEHETYRRLYRLDEELNPEDQPPELRDNWLASRRWYEQAIRAVDVGGHPLGTKNPTTFFDSPARSQISHAEAIETEGTFGSRAKQAWREGAELWRDYGMRQMKSTEDFLISLLDEEKEQQRSDEFRAELDALSPGLKEAMRQEAEAALSSEQREMVAAFPESPTPEQVKAHQEATEALDITPEKIADRIAREEPAKAAAARKLATEIQDADRRVSHIQSNKDVANYDYWRVRCDLEQSDEALSAHEKAHEAKRAFRAGDPLQARKLYEQSFEDWAKALERFPEMAPESSTGSDLMDIVDEYVKVLEQLELSLADEEVDKRFALWHIVEANDQQREYADVLDAHKNRLSGRTEETLVNPAEAVPR